jgi:hypothetical protein
LFTLIADGQELRSPKEKSRLAAGLSLLSLQFSYELTSALALLIRVLALAVRVLLLLAGLLPAALLLAGLLARILAGILILLARIVLIVLVRHFLGSPLLNVTGDNRKPRNWFHEISGSTTIIAWQPFDLTVTMEPAAAT